MSHTRPLRPLTTDERTELTALSHAQSAPAIEVTRAILLLLVSNGHSYQCAARETGRKSGDAVAHLVARFNTDGLAAVTPRHGGGRASIDDTDARTRILREANRTPTPQHDGTATCSLTLLRKALRAAPDGLPRVSCRRTRSGGFGRTHGLPTSEPAPGVQRVRPSANAKLGW
ncbi:helix-turn-helix domain-containing protein [Fimbriiglobus ruber]|uniref:helix-turn-helix domain-containing protein n=1 Tax=Fimbriiglobus ruber TaxID=1908690 RepID=UPI001930FD1F|nr:helix-turn-helix domain-containing protein [Fimbriiglobus ruber]